MDRLIWRKPEEMAAALASVGSIPKSAVCCLAQSVRLVTTTGSPSGVRRCQILAFLFCGPLWPSGNASAAFVPWARFPVFSAAAAAFRLAEASGVNIRQIQRVELGEAETGNLTARNLIAIADALGVDVRSLI